MRDIKRFYLKRLKFKVKSNMSSDSDSDRDTKVYKLRSRKNFPSWKQKTLSMASSKGHARFLLEKVDIKTEDEIDAKETEMIEEKDVDNRRKLKAEARKWIKERKKSLEAAAVLTCSVKTGDLKMLSKCKQNPKKMFDLICSKYGKKEDSDLTELTHDLSACKLKGKYQDPGDWFDEIDEINSQLEIIDKDFSKSRKELAAHIINSLPKGYKSIKTVIQMEDDYLDNLDEIKKVVTNHWKVNYRNKVKKKKVKTYASESDDDDLSSDSSSEESDSSESTKKKKKKKSKDRYALTVADQTDTINEEGRIVCGYCKTPGHSIKKCWKLNGKPADYNSRYNGGGNGNSNSRGRGSLKCWICGEPGHISRDCPNNKFSKPPAISNERNESEQEEANINSLFIGVIRVKKIKEGEEDAESVEFVEVDNDSPAAAIISQTQEEDSYQGSSEFSPVKKKNNDEGCIIIERKVNERCEVKKLKEVAKISEKHEGKGVLKAGLNKCSDGVESLSSFEYVGEEQCEKEFEIISCVARRTEDSVSRTKQDSVGVRTSENPTASRSVGDWKLATPSAKERKTVGPNRKLRTGTRAKTRRDQAETKGCATEAKNKDGNFKSKFTTIHTKVETRNEQARHDKVKTKMKAIEALIEHDKEIQDLNFESWTQGPNLTKSANESFKLPQGLKDRIESGNSDNNHKGRGTARLPNPRESTIREARDFVRQHWGEAIAREEFPHSSEDDEVVDVEWFDDMIYLDSRDSSSETIDLEFNDESGNDNQVNMVTKCEDHDMGKGEWWLGDTGASCHVTNDERKIMKLVPSANDRVIVGDQRKCEVTKKGQLLTLTEDENCLLLMDVRVVSEMGKNILSVGALLDDGGKLKGGKNEMIVDYKGILLKFRRNHKDGLYYTKLKRVQEDEDGKCYNVGNDRHWELVGNNNKAVDKSKWKCMNRMEAHQKWGHQHEAQLNKIANHHQIRLQGKMTACAGCALVKSRTKAHMKTSSNRATRQGQRLFVDTTGPYPRSRGGMKYWACAVDDYTDFTWVNFAPSKNKMVEFVTSLIKEINALGYKVEYLRCDNAGEHMSRLVDLCTKHGVVLEYTAPNSPQQNGRCEKKIHVVWQRSMVFMVFANMTIESQTKFWAEAVGTSCFHENLTIKAERISPALESWTHKPVKKWMSKLIEFGRVGVMNKKRKIHGKMQERGEVVMMVGYALNHGSGTYRVYNPKTNRIVLSKDVTWGEFKPKRLEASLDVFSIDDSESQKSGETSSESDTSTISSEEHTIISVSDSSSSSSSEESEIDGNASEGSSDAETSKSSKATTISKPRARRRTTTSTRKSTTSAKGSRPTPPSSIKLRRATRSSTGTKLRSGNRVGGPGSVTKRVTGDTTARRVRIHDTTTEAQDRQVNMIDQVNLSEQQLDQIYVLAKETDEDIFEIYTLELVSDDDTPTDIFEAINGKDKVWWTASAIAEVNNFLKRDSWRFVKKASVLGMGRKPIGVKWVFKKKNEADYSIRYKTRVVTKGYMQIPGVDYTEKFSPVAQPTSVRIVLAMVLWLFWICELIDIEAAFLEGRLKVNTYIDLPPGLVELGFMTQEEYDEACIELQGGMYGNVDSALLYFVRFKAFATSEEGLKLKQSQADPCLFFEVDAHGSVNGVIVIYVDNCLLAGPQEFVDRMKAKIKEEFGVVEDGQLRKLLGVRYSWDDVDDPDNARVTLSMGDKADEIVKAFEKATGRTPRVQSTPGIPGKVLSKNEEEPYQHDDYRSILGKAMFYVTKIAPECSFAINQLARHMHNPGKAHWQAMERFIGYLKGKKKHELVICRPIEPRVFSFGDSSYADCRDTRKSSTGDLHTIGGALVSWRAQKTKCVCLSSAEAEYVELTDMCKEQKFIQMVLEEVFGVKSKGVMYEDNEAAIYLTKNQHVSPRTKHIDVRQHYIREYIEAGNGEIRKVNTEFNFADILTKNVSVGTFKRLGNGILHGFAGFNDMFRLSHVQREND